jgi:hypothetical protein
MSDVPPTPLRGVRVTPDPDVIGGSIYTDVETGEVVRIEGPPTYWIESSRDGHWTKKQGQPCTAT